MLAFPHPGTHVHSFLCKTKHTDSSLLQMSVFACAMQGNAGFVKSGVWIYLFSSAELTLTHRSGNNGNMAIFVAWSKDIPMRYLFPSQTNNSTTADEMLDAAS